MVEPIGGSRADELTRREAAVEAAEREAFERGEAIGRRRRVLSELREYVREREMTLRGRAARLGIPASQVMASLPELSDDSAATAEEAALASETDAVLDAREATLARREGLVSRRRAWIEAAAGMGLGAEERLIAREQALADAFRALVVAAGEPQPAQMVGTAVRRRHQRIEVRVPVQYGGAHNFIAAESANFSAGGVFVATRDALSPGRTIALRLQLPGDGEVEVSGVVVWRRAEPDATGPEGFGVRFLDLDATAERAIGRFLAYRAPLPSDWLS